jgi:hypothetical protein
MYRRQHATPAARRGVILLVVVILLTLFAVVGLSFVLYAESEANSSRIARDAEVLSRDDASPDALFAYFMGQLIYDASDTDGNGVYSALRGHSLARLMYGWNSDPGASNNTPFNGVGRLHNPYPASYADGTALPVAFTQPPQNDDYYYVNYTYFQSLLPLNAALRIRDPERLGFRQAPTQATYGTNAYTGGFNPPYTYPDLNNMFLAWVDTNQNSPTYQQVQLSSYHRDWTGFNQSGGNAYTRFDPANPNWYIPSVAVAKYVGGQPPVDPRLKYWVLRPRPADQLLATDVIPNGFWPPDPIQSGRSNFFPAPEDKGGDVKNLVGAPGGNDSIWLDLGAPVMVGPDGKKYKALFAPLILDLGGRININVHGNLRDGTNKVARSNHGLGPWEVNPQWVFDPNNQYAGEWTNLLLGNGQIAGRYGADQQPGTAGASCTALGYSLQQPFPPASVNGARTHAGWPHFYAPYDYDGANESANYGPSAQIVLPPNGTPTAFPTYGNGYTFPTALNGYGSGQAGELLNHPMAYNFFNPAGGDRVFRWWDLEALLRYGDTGAPAMTSEFYKLLPNTFANANSRQLLAQTLTAQHFDLDVPGLTPMMWNPLQWTDVNGQVHQSVQYQLGNGNPYPTILGGPPNSAPGSNPMYFPPVGWVQTYGQRMAPGPVPQGSEFNTPGQDPTNPANNTKVDWRGNFTYSSILNPVTGNPISTLSPRYDLNQITKAVLNQPLTPYPEPDTTNGQPNPGPATGRITDANAFTAAQLDRQKMAAQLYGILLAVTGAQDPNTVQGLAAPQVNAARWLAQLAVNIVDYIDDDDYMTPFNWYPKDPNPSISDWVFGTELPRVVLNEAYVEKNATANPETDDVWIELYNTFNTDPTLPVYGQDATTVNALPSSARLYMPPSGMGKTDDYGVYQIVIMKNDNPNLQNPVNVAGDPTPGNIFNYNKAGTPTPAVVDFKTASPPASQDKYFIGPSNRGSPGIAKAATAHTQGYYVVGSPNVFPDPALMASTTPMTPTYQTAQLSYLGNSTPPTIVLRRLACPNLAPNPTPGPGYNPYVTVDAMVDVPFALSTDPPTTNSQGRYQPYAGDKSQRTAQAAQAAVAAVKGYRVNETFFASNLSSTAPATVPFEWLVQLDRQLTSPMELLQVSGFKPHELTQRFKYVSAGGTTVSQGHIAPWYDKAALIYRFLEYVETGPLASGTTAGGRIPGKININAISPTNSSTVVAGQPTSSVFEALCDPANAQVPANNSSPNVFTQTDVDNAYWTMMKWRTPGITNPATPYVAPFSQNDRPFLPLSVGYDTGGAAPYQYPNGLSLDNTVLTTAGGAGSPFDVTSQTHPYLKKQLLTKIYNNLSTRSNVFAVWVTVGFFEVIDDTSRPVKLGAEIGRAEGRNIRHRMFAIVDRSVLTQNPGPQPAFDPRAATSPGALNSQRVVPYFSIIQ